MSRGFGSPLVYLALLLAIAVLALVFHKTSAEPDSGEHSADSSMADHVARNDSYNRRMTSRTADSSSLSYPAGQDLRLSEDLDEHPRVIQARKTLRELRFTESLSDNDGVNEIFIDEIASAKSSEERYRLVMSFRGRNADSPDLGEDLKYSKDEGIANLGDALIQLENYALFLGMEDMAADLHGEILTLLDSVDDFSLVELQGEIASKETAFSELQQQFLKIRRNG